MSRSTEVIIGLDVGTTAVKVAAFAVVSGRSGTTATPQATALREYPLQQPVAGWQVQDPPTILAAIDSAVSACAGQLIGVTRSDSLCPRQCTA